MPILLDVGAARTAAGRYVPFVVAFNVVAAPAYLAVAFGLAGRQPWVRRLATWIALATAGLSAAFAAHVISGGAFENRTVVALAIRLAVFVVIARMGYRLVGEDVCVPRQAKPLGAKGGT